MFKRRVWSSPDLAPISEDTGDILALESRMTWRDRYFAEGKNVRSDFFSQFAPSLFFFSARPKFFFAVNHARNDFEGGKKKQLRKY